MKDPHFLNGIKKIEDHVQDFIIEDRVLIKGVFSASSQVSYFKVRSQGKSNNQRNRIGRVELVN